MLALLLVLVLVLLLLLVLLLVLFGGCFFWKGGNLQVM